MNQILKGVLFSPLPTSFDLRTSKAVLVQSSGLFPVSNVGVSRRENANLADWRLCL